MDVTKVRLCMHYSLLLPLAMIMALSFVLLSPLETLANTVTIIDQSHVLNAGQVQAEAAELPVALLIYTTNTFQGDIDALNQDARHHLPNQQTIVIDIDTVNRNLSIQSGTSVKLSDSQASDAVAAFTNRFSTGGYTGATMAAIDSLRGSLAGESTTITPLGRSVGAILLIALVIAIILMVRSSRKASRMKGTPYDPTVDVTYVPHHHRARAYHSDSSYDGGSTYSSHDSGGGVGGSSGGDFGGGAGGHF
jgi:hypothetical protein